MPQCAMLFVETFWALLLEEKHVPTMYGTQPCKMSLRLASKTLGEEPNGKGCITPPLWIILSSEIF